MELLTEDIAREYRDRAAKLLYNGMQDIGERDTAKIPYLEGDGYADNEEINYDTWVCPNCFARYELDYVEHKFCPECGQRINWREMWE